uniref:Lipoprotein n=1 Tax=Streptomyces citricolor TaxID=212427 RepID=A0A7R6JWJ5_9ACTN|nr:hypothetical protein [Streptomyces citricolor]
MASSAGIRSTRAALAAGAVAALLTLSACGPAASGSTGAAPAGAPAGGGPAAGGAGAPAGAPAAQGSGGGPSYVLSAPPVAGGYPQGQPSAATARLVGEDIQRNAKRLGLSGTPVKAVYDDRADGAWIFYSGVNGTGFAPDKLHDALEQIPVTSDNGAGDRVTTNAVDTDPGPHGGRAICNSVLVRAGLLTTMATTCSWFTPTTAAGVTLVLKGDGSTTKLGFSADDVAPVMRAVRADVEQRR